MTSVRSQGVTFNSKNRQARAVFFLKHTKRELLDREVIGKTFLDLRPLENSILNSRPIGEGHEALDRAA